MLKKALQKIAQKIEAKMPQGVQVKGTENSLEVYAEDYMLFRDQGVDGTKKKNSPNKKYDLGAKFSYKGKMPPSKDLAKWAKKKGLQLKKGMTYEGLGFVIARSIKEKGIKPSLYLTKPFIDVLDKEDFDEVVEEMLKELK